MRVFMSTKWTPTLCRFYSSQERFKLLQYALDEYEDTNFIPFRVQTTPSCFGRSFSNAFVDPIPYLLDASGRFVTRSEVSDHDFKTATVKTHRIPFKSMFRNGFDAFRRSLNNERIVDPNLALASEVFLSAFLSKFSFHERCLHSVLESKKENYVTVILANHLFSKLTFSNDTITRYSVLTSDTRGKYLLEKCPCSMNCGEEIPFDSTGFGSELLWYGRPDIMIFPMNCGIVVPEEKLDEDTCENDILDFSPEERKDQCIEMKKNSGALRFPKNIHQITAMALTFSLYQQAFQQRKYNHRPKHESKAGKQASHNKLDSITLIPFIAASSKDFDIYLYDYKNDIFLRNSGPPIPLWKWSDQRRTPKLDPSSILKLWMVINYMATAPSLSDSDLKTLSGSCQFVSKMNKNFLGDVLESMKMDRHFNPKPFDDYDVPYYWNTQNLNP